MEKKIVLTCDECGEIFLRRLTEYKREKNKGKLTFCGLSCSASWGGRNVYRKRIPPAPGSNRDQYTPFRYFIKVTKARKKKEHDINKEYLKELWKSQKGRCPVTDWELSLPKNSDRFENKAIYNASLDRIDSSKGYIRGNVRFVARIVNYAKSDWGDDVLYKFAEAVYNKHGGA